MSKGLRVHRRHFLAAAAATAALPALPRIAFAATPSDTPVHGLSAFGALKYAPDFTHFGYVNPDAPKGGEMRFAPPNWNFNQNTETFNTLNSFVTKGDAPPRMTLCFDALMTSALDEPDSIYGLLAESVTISVDRNTYTFRLRPQAKWHDGTPLTAGDCAFTYQTFKASGHPQLQLPLATLKDVSAPDPLTLELVFDGEHNDRTILDVAGMPIISRAFYTANPFDASSVTPPLGSGPYKVGDLQAGRFIVYERVADYWGKDLAVNRGQYNFDRIRIDFFLDRQPQFEALKKGEIEFRQEFTSKGWATAYDFPAVKDGRIIKREFPGEKRPSMQAWAPNQRRERFRDRRVREAIALCFDFEWTRQNLFFGSYTRSDSLFEKSDFKASGKPSAAELAIMEPLRGKIPDEAFGEAVSQVPSDGSGRDRKKLRRAVELFQAAGWKRDGTQLKNAKGETFPLEFLIDSESFVRILQPYVEALRTVGVDASIRLVDPAQYNARQRDFDFDVVMMALSFEATPTQSSFDNMLMASAAKLPGSYNLPGTEDVAIDELVRMIGKVTTRDELVTVMRVIDRVLRARMDWLPTWHLDTHRAVFWDKFGFVEPKPDYGFPVEILWWQDEVKEAKLRGK